MTTAKYAYVAAGIAGVALWVATSHLTGRLEAWDAAEYWSLTYPLGIVVAGALAYVAPHTGAWRLGLVLMVAQAVTLAVMARSFGLLPLGLVLFTILSIPPAAIATVASAVAQRRRAGA